MNYLIVIFLLSWGLLYGASTSSEINQSEKTLSATSSAKQKASRRLDKIANDIKSAERDIISIDNKIDNLARTEKETQKQYESLKEELSDFDADLNKSTETLNGKQEKFIRLLSEQFSIAFAMNQSHEPTQESIVLYEVYDTYKKQNTSDLSLLRTEIFSLRSSQKSKLTQRSKTENKINGMREKRKLLSSKKASKVKILKKLSVYEEKYNTKLEKIVDKQNSLRATLSKLNILRKKEVELAEKRAAQKKEAMRRAKAKQREIRRAKAKARKAKEALRRAKTQAQIKKAKIASEKADKEEQRIYQASAKVKHVNSSYKKSGTYKYRGGKTISPLSNARLIKGFGTYIDPIYKIKIFNESITLQAQSSNAKVKNVLNGKVVFAGKSSMLGKVVVVSHSRKIHTVYAGLSKIAPTIHNGAKIKKGYIVGKVSRKLIFQATKNSKHINPLELIEL